MEKLNLSQRRGYMPIYKVKYVITPKKKKKKHEIGSAISKRAAWTKSFFFFFFFLFPKALIQFVISFAKSFPHKLGEKEGDTVKSSILIPFQNPFRIGNNNHH